MGNAQTDKVVNEERIQEFATQIYDIEPISTQASEERDISMDARIIFIAILIGILCFNGNFGEEVGLGEECTNPDDIKASVTIAEGPPPLIQLITPKPIVASPSSNPNPTRTCSISKQQVCKCEEEMCSDNTGKIVSRTKCRCKHNGPTPPLLVGLTPLC